MPYEEMDRLGITRGDIENSTDPSLREVNDYYSTGTKLGGD